MLDFAYENFLGLGRGAGYILLSLTNYVLSDGRPGPGMEDLALLDCTGSFFPWLDEGGARG